MQLRRAYQIVCIVIGHDYVDIKHHSDHGWHEICIRCGKVRTVVDPAHGHGQRLGYLKSEHKD